MKSQEELFCDLNVSVYHNHVLEYSDEPPYSPHIKYPEYVIHDVSDKENNVYEGVRNAFLLLGLDKVNYGTLRWNPLKEIITPGDKVVIKPNFVVSSHEERGDLFSIITHPTVIRAIVDYVYIALNGKGKIIIADAPQMDCDFNELLDRTKLKSIKELYEREVDFDLEIYDLRDFWLDKGNNLRSAYSRNRHKLPSDPMGSVLVNLGKASLFYGVKNYNRFYGADYNRDETIKHHHGDIQEYLVSKTVLSADVVISVPKLKVHKKVGVTLNLKGLVGININKNYLVHYTLGTPSKGGDQFPDGILSAKDARAVKLQRWAYDKLLSKKNRKDDLLFDMVVRLGNPLLRLLGLKLAKDKAILDAGNWYGNDSAWRMAMDLLRIFAYVDGDGNLREMPVRRMFSVVDGVVGGEKDGPLAPSSKRCGLIVAGFNPCAVDLVCTRLIGFDCTKVKMFAYVLNHPELFKVSLPKVKTYSNIELNNLFDSKNKNKYFNFIPPFGWKGAIEIE